MKPIQLRESDFKREVFRYTFPKEILQEFFDYWTEPNKSNTKMRFELEKTWHLGRRLTRWAANSKTVVSKAPVKVEHKDPTNDFERLDAFIMKYREGKVTFEDHGQWYDFMKENRLLKPLTKGDVETLRKVYGQDNQKCRCAVVMDTLSGYVNNGFKVVDIVRLRERI